MILNNSKVINANFLKKFKLNIEKTRVEFNFVKKNFNRTIPLLKYYTKSNPFTNNLHLRRFFKYKNIVIIGMGGSSLGIKCIHSFFKNNIKKNILFFDDLDINLYKNLSNLKNVKNTCFLIISKSGNTLETLTNFNAISPKLINKNNALIITENNLNALNIVAKKNNIEILKHPRNVGGRFSIFSEVGFFPATLMGVKVNKIIKNLKIFTSKKMENQTIKNTAFLFSLYQAGYKNNILLNYDKDLNDLCFWYQQLICESLGKNRKGFLTMLSPMPRDNHSMLQFYLDGFDKSFFTFLNSKEAEKIKISNKYLSKNQNFLSSKSVKAIINAQNKAAKIIFKKNNKPFRDISIKKNEKDFAFLISLLILETIVLGRLLKINPFNQPAVEEVKIETKKILQR